MINILHGIDRRSQARLLWPVVVAAVLGVLLSFGAWQVVSRWEERTAREKFASTAADIASVLENGLKEYTSKVEALRAFFDGSLRVERDEFEIFTGRIFPHGSDILSIAWNPRVLRDERRSHEAEGAQEGLVGYGIYEPGNGGTPVPSLERDEYFPKFYSSNGGSASEALGVDFSRDDILWGMLGHARDTGELAVVSERTHSRSGGQTVRIAAPIFRKALPHGTIDERRANLAGFVSGTFKPDTMIDTIFANYAIPTDVELLVLAKDGGPIYRRPIIPGSALPSDRKNLAARGAQWSSAITIGDISWTLLVAQKTASAVPTLLDRAWIVLCGGLLIALIMVTYLWKFGLHALGLELANREISEHKGKAEKLNEILKIALNNMARGLSMFGADQRLIVCNKAYQEIYDLPDWLAQPGTSLEQIIGFHAERETGARAADDIDRQKAWIANHTSELARGKCFSDIHHLNNGRTILVSNQPLPDGGWVDLDEDITERRQAEQRINWLARYDALTEIPNRFHFQELLEESLRKLRPGEGLALHWVDLDGFKQINDIFGHPVGDLLLKNVGARLGNAVRKPDFVGRVGGDEFAIVQTGVTDEAQATSFANRIMNVFSETQLIDGARLEIRASVGVALAPKQGSTADQLLKNADVALYMAKSHRRGTIALFQPAYGELIEARQQLEDDLRAAVEKQQLVLYYQPIVDAKTHKVKSFEALMRWLHPTRGLVSPAEFIPLAEETGLIVAMGAWALEQACHEAMNWPDNVSVAVNLSSLQFEWSDFLETVTNALQVSGLRANRLELEITETALLKDDATIMEVLKLLSQQGVRMSLDDFGTAYSSLSYLKRFPFDQIKIDRSFVQEVPSSKECSAIIEAVAGLAKRLGMTVVAEGVETQEQLKAVIELGCDDIQGFYFSPPVPATKVQLVIAGCGSELAA